MLRVTLTSLTAYTMMTISRTQEALSGRAHTTMLATVSPSSDSYVETMNTLKYAERLRKASAHLYWNRDMAGGKVTKVHVVNPAKEVLDSADTIRHKGNDIVINVPSACPPVGHTLLPLFATRAQLVGSLWCQLTRCVFVAPIVRS